MTIVRIVRGCGFIRSISESHSTSFLIVDQGPEIKLLIVNRRCRWTVEIIVIGFSSFPLFGCAEVYLCSRTFSFGSASETAGSDGKLSSSFSSERGEWIDGRGAWYIYSPPSNLRLFHYCSAVSFPRILVVAVDRRCRWTVVTVMGCSSSLMIVRELALSLVLTRLCWKSRVGWGAIFTLVAVVATTRATWW
jgi:hypothetical protein